MFFKTDKYPDVYSLVKSLSTSDPRKFSDFDLQKIRYFVHSDGCTNIPNIFKDECFKHDFYYRTHLNFGGCVILRKHADWLFLRGMQAEARLAVLDPIPWVIWLGVRLFGSKNWYR